MPMEYYAVKVGRVPGIYDEDENWYDQVKGFKNAEYAVFTDINNARVYMRSKKTPVKNSTSYKGSKLSYFKAKKNLY